MTPRSTYSPGTTLFNFQDSKRDGESKTVLRGNLKVPGLVLVYSGVHFIITLVFYTYISLFSPFNKKCDMALWWMLLGCLPAFVPHQNSFLPHAAISLGLRGAGR